MINLIDEISKNYNFLTFEVPNLEVGQYEIKNYYLTENDKFGKILYLDTNLGFYQTKSRIMIGSMYGIIGKIIDSAIENNESISVEIVNKRSINGYMSLGFRTI